MNRNHYINYNVWARTRVYLYAPLVDHILHIKALVKCKISLI